MYVYVHLHVHMYKYTGIHIYILTIHPEFSKNSNSHISPAFHIDVYPKDKGISKFHIFVATSNNVASAQNLKYRLSQRSEHHDLIAR